jgi:hypothetical protein
MLGEATEATDNAMRNRDTVNAYDPRNQYTATSDPCAMRQVVGLVEESGERNHPSRIQGG